MQRTQSSIWLMLVSTWTASVLALCTMFAGCATSKEPKPGSGIAEYRQLVREAHGAVTETVRALDALAVPPEKTSQPHPAIADFDRALQTLEVTSLKTRARAEAIMARGEVYFEEWKQQLAGTTDPSAARSGNDRYTRLRDQFERVRERSGVVRTEFRPFMMKLRELRATLDKTGAVSDSATAQAAAQLGADGRRVIGALGAVSTALDDAEVVLHATATRPSGAIEKAE